MKTIREIAEEIGVSKQAVYKRYKGKLYKMVFPHTRKVGDTIYILEQGERIIKQDFLQDNASYGAHTEYIQNRVISILERELEIKNKQIEELIAIVKAQEKNANKSHERKCYTRKKVRKAKVRSTPVDRLFEGARKRARGRFEIAVKRKC